MRLSDWIALAATVAVLIGLTVLGSAMPPQTAPPLPAAAAGPGLAAADRGLPLYFEANQGQTAPDVKFLARAGGHTLFLTTTETVLVLGPPKRGRGPDREQAIVRMRLVGAGPAPEVVGQAPLSGKIHYLAGADPARWRRDVPAYARVIYRAVYPGVDLVYHGAQGQLEYDFVVAPGADPRAIRLVFEGADTLRLDAQGDLRLTTRAGELRFPRPVVYQETGGGRREVPGGYVVAGREVTFQVAAYDATRPLVIDPRLDWSTYLGGSVQDGGQGIAVDAAGAIYITGWAGSTDFPTAHALQPAPGGSDDVFVAKLSPDGSTLVYATYLGGSDLDLGFGIAVDAAGQAYVTGETRSADFPTVNAAQPLIYGDGVFPACHPRCFAFNAFLAKLNPEGSALVYSTYLGGHDSTIGFAVAVDGAGNAYVAGRAGADVPAARHLGPRAGEAFVAKHSPTGALLYVADFGSGIARSIAVDGSGNAYVTGATEANDFPTTPGALQPTGGCPPSTVFECGDAFVAKLGPTGSSLAYGTYLGGSGDERGLGIAVDAGGNAYVTGSTTSTDFPTLAGALQPAPGGGSCRFGPCRDAFVVKLDAAGSRLLYATYLGGSQVDEGIGIAVDGAGHAFVAGNTASTDFPTVNPVQAAHSGASCETAECLDAFVAKLDASGSSLVWATYLGGNSVELTTGIALDGNGSAYLTGQTESSNFPTVNALQPARGGTVDAFVAKLTDTAGGGGGGGCTSGVQIGPTTATPSPVAAGSTETVQTTVCSASAAANLNVDLEIYNPSGKRVGQKIFSGQSFAGGEARSYTWGFLVPSTLPTGTYTVKIGVFSANWATLLKWDNQAVTFAVSGAPPPSSCASGITIGPTAATPATVARGSTETIQTQVCSGSAASNLNVDLELYDASGKRVGQKIFSGQSFAAGESKSYTWPFPVPSTLPTGTYTVKVGVFSANWTTLFKWDNQAATFVVQ